MSDYTKPVEQMNEVDCLRAIVISLGTVTIDPTAFAAYIATLPTSDPHVLGVPWNNGGFLAISTG